MATLEELQKAERERLKRSCDALDIRANDLEALMQVPLCGTMYMERLTMRANQAAVEPASTVQRIKALCNERRYDEAIKLTDDLLPAGFDFAVRAHLLVMEHERRYHLDQETKQP